MNNKLRNLIRIVIILIGVGILVYPSVSVFLMHQNSSRVIASYDDSVNMTRTERLEALMNEAIEYNKLLVSATNNDKPPFDADGNPISLDSYDRMLNLNGDGMMGYISIPKLNLTARILHGTEESALQVAIGHMKNTSLPVGGNSTHAVLSGHRGLPTNDLFTDIDRIEIGDKFYIKVLNSTLCYTVDQIVTVLPDETEELAIKKGKDYVTLVTCTPYGINSHRLLVRGVRTEYDEAEGISVYEPDENESFWWDNLPVQYRHMMIGLVVIIAFLILYLIFRIVKRIIKKRRVGNNEQDTENSETN